MNTRRRFLLVSQALGRVPSVLYGSFYLALIPIFAGLYQLMPNAFYHSTAHMEPIFHSERQAISENLKSALRTSSSYVRMRVPKIYLKWHPEKVYGLHATPDGRMKFGLNGISVTPGGVAIWSLNLEAFIWDEFSDKSKPLALLPACYADDYTAPRHSLGYLLPNPRYFNEEELANPPRAGNGRCGGVLAVPRPLLRRMQKFYLTSQGLAGRAPKNFGRMLYLSAVTITTTGFGDIVPLTEQARTLVTTEAMVGVILVGLFLNALAHEITVGPDRSS